jgi:hypothetical protein
MCRVHYYPRKQENILRARICWPDTVRHPQEARKLLQSRQVPVDPFIAIYKVFTSSIATFLPRFCKLVHFFARLKHEQWEK